MLLSNFSSLTSIEVLFLLEECEDIKGAIKIRISKKNLQHNGQNKKYKRTNNDLQSNRSSNTNPTKNLGWTQVLRKGKQFLLH